MELVFLDVKTMGDIPNLNRLETYGNVTYHQTTRPEQTLERIREADIIITNKVVLDEALIGQARRLKLICVAATGMNNVGQAAARKRGIPVKNARDYSTQSVAQGTFAILFQLLVNIPYFDQYVKAGGYAKTDIFTHFGNGFRELSGKRFGIDVFTREPINPQNPLLHVRNNGMLVLTPHVTWASLEARTMLMEQVGRNIDEFLSA